MSTELGHDQPEQPERPRPREALERFLEGEAPGSTRIQTIAAEVTSARLDAEITAYQSDYEMKADNPLMATAIAQKAAVDETLRQLRFGPDAATYDETRRGVLTPGGIWDQYMFENQFLGPDGQERPQYTTQKAANALLKDLSQINLGLSQAVAG